MERPKATQPPIVCKGVRKKFGAVEALSGVDLEVVAGTTFGLIGPNGAGKTTLIRVLLGLTRPDAGKAFALGRNPGASASLSRIGYMPQDLAIYPDLTVQENLDLFGRLMGMDEDRIRNRSEEVLSVVDLSDRRRSMVSSLSGGMRRRASLASALLPDPDLLLLDEPTVGVDPELRHEFWSFFDELNRRGRTIMITTHYMDEASRCDRVGLIHRGRLIAEGPPADIKKDTRTTNLEDAFLALARKEAA